MVKTSTTLFRYILICTGILFAFSGIEAQTVPPEENPCDAPPQCGFNAIDQYNLDMEGTPSSCNWPNEPGCQLHDPNWFAFVAGGNQVSLTIEISNCIDNIGVQFSAYGGDPSCSGSCNYSGLEGPLAGNCSVPLLPAGNPHIYNFNTTPGFTYYLVFDGYSDDLCEISITINDGGEAPMVDEPGEPQSLQFPEFDGPDTICVGATNVTVSLPNLPFGASRIIWTINGGNEIEGPVGSASIDIPPSLLTSPGTIEICAYAINDCDESNTVCKEYEVAYIDPTFEEFTVCEGDAFTWEGNTYDTDNITSDQTIEDEITKEATAGCQYQAHLTLNITNENDENPNQVYDVLCSGNTYMHPSGFTTMNGVQDRDYVTTNAQGCDEYYNFTIEVIGGDFTVLPPDDCNGDGSITLETLFTPIWANTVPIDDPDLEVEYQWYVNSNPISGATGESLVVTQAMIENNPFGQYDVHVTMTYEGKTCEFESTTEGLEAADFLPSIDSISGPDDLCFESQGIYEVFYQNPDYQNYDDEVSAFIWDAPPGVEIPTNGNNPVTVEVGPGAMNGEICVVVSTDCGFTDEACIDVDITNPVDPEIGAVNNDPCSFSYSFSPQTADQGQWLVLNQPDNSSVVWTPADTDPNATLEVDSVGTYQVAWREGEPGCEKFDTVSLMFTGRPEILNVSEECNDPPTDYNVTFTIEGGAPPYSLVSSSHGGTISGNSFTSDDIPQMTDYYFLIEDANGCRSDTISGFKICDCDTDAADMEPDTLEACGMSGCVMGVPMGSPTLDGDDVIEYALHEGSGNSLVDVIEIKDNPMFCYRAEINYEQVYYISRIVGSDDGNGNVDLDDGCLSVAPGQPVIWHEQPVADAGMAQIDSCGMEASLSANPSVGDGRWSMVSGPGSASFSPADAPNTSVTVTDFGTYTFEWTEDNFGCVDSDTVSVTFHDAPVMVNGSFNAECLPSLDYVITFEITGGSPPYILSLGDGQLNGNMYRDTLGNGDAYEIEITDQQGCGPLEVTGMQDCNCNSVAGEMSSEVLDTCSNLCVTAEHLGMDSLEANDASMFVLHDQSGSMLGNVIAFNASGTFCYQDYPSDLIIGNTYYISYVVGNDDGSGLVDLDDPCLAVAPGQPVIFYKPPFVNAGSNDEACGFNYILQAEQDTGSGNWELVSGPGDASFDASGDKQTEVTVTEYGNYCFAWTGMYAGCSNTDTTCVEFLDAPKVDPASVQYKCNPLNTGYTVTFVISGGEEGSYGVGGGPGILKKDSIFTSAEIPSGDPYTFYVFDGNRCDSVVVSNVHTCVCGSDAGTMSPDTVNACPGDEITVEEAMSTTLEFNDILRYVLHEGSSDSIVGKIAENDVPTFSFDPGSMNYNQVYYISSVVGYQDSTGGIHPDDVCRNVSEGTPVVWYEPPTASVDPDIDTITCTQTSVALDGSPSTDVTGQGLDFLWTDENGMEVGNTVQVDVGSYGDYTLLVTDLGSGCTNEVTVNVPRSEDTPLADIEQPGTITCAQQNITLDANGSSQGAEFSYNWTSNPSGLNISDPTILDPNVNQGGTYILTVTNDNNGCTSTASVTVAVDTTHPVADAIAAGELNCTSESVMIDATNSSQGPEFQYNWTPSGLSGLEPVVTQAGDYTLEVVNTQNGCTSSTTVTVEQDTNVIRDAMTDLRNPSCDGQATGKIEVTQVIGGTPSFTYILNDGESQNNTGIFQNLGAGEFSVEVIDSKGCTYMIDDIELIEPEPLEVYLQPSLKIELGDDTLLQPEILPLDRELESINWTSDPVDSLLTCDTCRNISISPKELTVYKVTVVDENGCVATASSSVAVEIPRNVYIPNIFTPNGDGVNDIFFLQAKEGEIANIESMAIFDRWGNRVFQRQDIPPNDPEFGWDGTHDGQLLNPAVFVYVFEVEYFDGVVEQVKGDVTLIR